MEEAINVINLNKSFDGFKVLENLNLSVKKGEILGMIGPSGEGKSVLIKSMIGFLKPDSGKVISSVQKIGFSMQNNSLYEHLTVKQNMDYFGKIYGVSGKERKERREQLLMQLDLKRFEDTVVKNISGGTKKKVDIACAIIHDPDLLFLDEPFLGLDPKLTEMLARFILFLNQQGKTVIISSHILNEISRICSRFVLIKNKVAKEIKKTEIKGAYG